jgi:hypothetical protein
MSFDHGDGFGYVFSNCVDSETWPCGEIAVLDGLDPCQRHRITTCSVHALDEFRLGGYVIGTVSLRWSVCRGIVCWHLLICVEWDLP